MEYGRKRIGELLIDAGLISPEQLQNALALQRQTGKKIGELMIEQNMVTEKDILNVLRSQMGFTYLELDKEYIDPEITKFISESLARRHVLMPIRKENKTLFIAMADPLNILAIDDVQIATGLKVEQMLATSQDIINTIDRYYRKQSTEEAMEDFKKQYETELESIKDLDEEIITKINNAPLVRLVNSIIKQAVVVKASDIHIEPFEKTLRIRFRIDGDLQEILSPEKASHSAIVTRIKIMGKMDIAEKRVPQDGRVEMIVDNRPIDLRISVLPTAYGEKIVIRLLDQGNFLVSKEQLGFNTYSMNVFDNILRNPNGIILVTGPTGSGKSTTLYAMLQDLNKINKNIITVEDPIEYRMEGINQVQVNNKAGLTFASGLRSMLRQDPDIIMIGEIRDTETAQIAVRAAITGHLVLSTVHTNDTASTVTRLMDMGIESYLISNALVGVISQRLVKKICVECKANYEADDLAKKLLHVEIDKPLTIYKGEGCPSCNMLGYKGRTTIVEILPITKAIKGLIDEGASIEKIKEKAIAEGMETLRDNCIKLVLQGTTTIEELIRNTYSLD